MRISYGRKMWDKNGTFYSQRILLTREEFSKIQEAFAAEIATGFPNRKSYSSYNNSTDLQMYFKPLSITVVGFPNVEKDTEICFLTLTQAKFVGRYSEIKSRFKTDRNSYIEIVS